MQQQNNVTKLLTCVAAGKKSYPHTEISQNPYRASRACSCTKKIQEKKVEKAKTTVVKDEESEPEYKSSNNSDHDEEMPGLNDDDSYNPK